MKQVEVKSFVDTIANLKEAFKGHIFKNNSFKNLDEYKIFATNNKYNLDVSFYVAVFIVERYFNQNDDTTKVLESTCLEALNKKNDIKNDFIAYLTPLIIDDEQANEFIDIIGKDYENNHESGGAN